MVFDMFIIPTCPHSLIIEGGGITGSTLTVGSKRALPVNLDLEGGGSYLEVECEQAVEGVDGV